MLQVKNDICGLSWFIPNVIIVSKCSFRIRVWRKSKMNLLFGRRQPISVLLFSFLSNGNFAERT